MTQVVCANCGQVLRPTDKFCYNCGAKVVPIKMAEEVKAQEPAPETVKPVQKAPVQKPQEAQEERPKFHMDESMSWNTDGYPDAQKHVTEEADFSWEDSTAQDRIRKRQEEGRRALYEEQKARQAAKALEENATEIKLPEEGLEVPDFKAEPEPEPVAEEAPAVEEPAAQPSDDFSSYSEPEADDDYEVPTIESIEAAAEAEKAKDVDDEAKKAREVEKEIFGYTIDDVEEGSGNAKVIDKFYTYSKKNEEFQELLNQENDRLKGNRPAETASEEPVPEPEEKPEEVKPLTEEEAEGFVGVQFPETPMEAVVEEKTEEPEFLDGNFGKTDTVEPEEKPEEAVKPAAAVAASAALAAIAEKAKARAAEAEAKLGDEDEKLDDVSEKAEEVKEEIEEKFEDAAEKVEEAEEKADEKIFEFEEAAEEKVEDVKEEAEEKIEAVKEEVEEKTEEAKEEVEDAFNKVKEEVPEKAEETAEKAEEIPEEIKKEVEEEEHKLTYQDVFSDQTEKTPKHTFLKILAILILLLIILEVAAILIRRFAPDSAAGIQIQQIYEMLFSRFTGN